MRATLVLEHLGNLLRAKAGITEPGPAASLAAELRSNPRWNGHGGAVAPETVPAPVPFPGALASPLPDQLRSVFEGREAADRDCVRWVARNLGTLDPDPETCPDPLAWSMLQYARIYPAGFWERVYPKIMPKTGMSMRPFDRDEICCG